MAIGLFALCGVSARDDVLERRNRAAAFCLSGTLVGITLGFAGGNIGDGPGWWVVLFSAALTTGTMFAMLVVLQVFTDVIESITIGRDEATGMRLGGFMAAAGLVLGRAVAGNWRSYSATVVDFARVAWPVLVLFGAALIVERLFRPTTTRPLRPVTSHGAVPAVVFVASAIVYVNLAWQAGPALSQAEFARVRRRAIFDCCKWDPQVEDVSALAPFPLLLPAAEWRRIRELAEELACETLAAEAEISTRPDLLRRLAIGRQLRAVFRRVADAGPSSGAARVMRFDFHLTTDGWRISEANTDVPGGFNEASGFTDLMARHCTSAVQAGDPARSYADAILRVTFPGAVVALVHATAYTDDRQVMVYLARHLEEFRAMDVNWAPAPAERTALVVELPGDDSLRAGLALARRGFRPVPLVNAVAGPDAVVEVESLLIGLTRGAVELQQIAIPDDAPPAFLLHADRMHVEGSLRPGKFDNRSMVFPQDFPSAQFLLAHGITRVLVVRRAIAGSVFARPHEDLDHVLLRWQQAGIRLELKNPLVPEPPSELHVRRPARFRTLWYRALAVFGLRRNSAGGFGSVIPETSGAG